MPGDVTQLLSAIDSGDSRGCGTVEELLPLIYSELRRLTEAKDKRLVQFRVDRPGPEWTRWKR